MRCADIDWNLVTLCVVWIVLVVSVAAVAIYKIKKAYEATP